MQIEHLAFNVREAKAMVAWYEEHLDMPVWKRGDGEVFVAFLGEPPSLLEIYSNPAHPFFGAGGVDPLTLHIAFTSHALAEDLERLIAAGATHQAGAVGDDGRGLIMLRCPWGLPLQLCRRERPLVSPS